MLGAARSLRRDLPPALVSVDRQGGRVMDWLLSAFAVLPGASVHFVSGYKSGEIQRRYPDIDVIHNADWETTGPARSLALAHLGSRTATYVTYADVVFRPDTVARLAAAEGDIVLAVDSAWRGRYDGRSRHELDQAEKVVFDGERLVAVGKQVSTDDAGAEFVGLLKLSGDTARRLNELLRSDVVGARAALPELISLLMDEGARARVVDVGGHWAELNAPQDLAHFVLGTKAESLARLAPLVRHGTIGRQVAFAQREWAADPGAVLARIRDTLGPTRLIVRSSALSEDEWHKSSAGAYESVLDVDGTRSEVVTQAVEEVLESYAERDPDDQVLVQEMLRDVEWSGVVMTRTPSARAPYYVVSFDDTSRRTDTVTGGTGDSVRTVFLHRDEPLPAHLPDRLGHLLTVVRELEELVGHDSLDIEFAYTSDDVCHVLQVRPIALPGVDTSSDDAAFARAIEQGKAAFQQLQQPTPFVVGRSTQLSVMSDWNPAEIVGTKPKRLAFSLYRHLVTDEAWARQRAEYGYRDVRPCNLIVDLLGHPYIDVRATFNSFVPATLPDSVAARLVDHYLARLTEHPELHDKVEFDVLFTCLTFDFDQRARDRLAGVLDEGEIAALRDGLAGITREGMARCSADFAQIDALDARIRRVLDAGLPPLEQAYVLLEDLRRTGIPLFAHLARAGFVAASLLRSLPSTGVIAEGLDGDFVATLDTVSSTIQHDAARVAAGDLDWDAFVAEYGHLRPGTYDVTSPRYAHSPELFLRPMVDQAGAHQETPAHPWDEGIRAGISRELAALGLDPDVVRFEQFLKHAIEGRELCKFVFTRGLSGALEALATFGEVCGLSRDELAHVRVEELLAFRVASVGRPADELRGLARRGAEAFRVTEALCLPGQVFRAEDLACFEQLKATPNFVTSKNVRAPLVVLSAASSVEEDVGGRIVVVPNADPGFDWLFSREIAGLVTMYGGRNSHMAIRAAEFGLPAAIGVGELLFEKLAEAELIELDCGSQQIRVVR